MANDILRIGCAAGFSGDRSDAAEPVVQALVAAGGRVADPSLTVGPALAHFGWARDDWMRIGRATMVGHLLECGTQVTGGYYADPGYRDVPGMARLGYPIAEIDADGNCTITKPTNTGAGPSSILIFQQRE